MNTTAHLNKEVLPPPTRKPNAWLAAADGYLGGLSVPLAVPFALASGIHDGDAVVLLGGDNSQLVIAFARVYRIRRSLKTTNLYFDGLLLVKPMIAPDTLGLPKLSSPVERLDWQIFEAALQSAFGISFAAFPTIAGQSPEERSHLRRLLQLATVDDLLGPATGPYEEVIGMSVRDRYLVGKLAPKDCAFEEGSPSLERGEAEEVPMQDLEAKANADHIPNDKKGTYRLSDKGEDEDNEAEQVNTRSLIPSSIGMTFCIDGQVPEIEVEASWGRYTRADSETETNPETGKPLRVWKRIPSGGVKRIPLVEGLIAPFVMDPNVPEVMIKGAVRATNDKGDRLVSLFLVNNQIKPETSQDVAWVFQPEIAARGVERQPVFHRRPVLESKDDDDPETRERIALEMVYRKRVEFAVGHGISVHATPAPDNLEKAIEIRTVVVPDYELPVTETPGTEQEDRPVLRDLAAAGTFDMSKLAEADRPQLLADLRKLTSDYAGWIRDQRDRIPTEFSNYTTIATESMERCEIILQRLEEGIATLENDDKALEAFRFANRAMAKQRVRSMYSLLRRRGQDVALADLDKPANRSWRPFQLAFVLLSIPALANPEHPDRTEPLMAAADLLWFPTGGGKTEAYLGVAAFTMAIRRRHCSLGGLDASRGLAVIMRYTLRLLTIQQFQRASTLLCSMETLRQENPETWGKTPFTLGLWVGNRVTPGTTERAHSVIENERNGRRGGSETPAQLTFCPWCGSEIQPGRDIDVDREQNRTLLYCGDKLSQCQFSKGKAAGCGLPVVVVDEEIYRRPPSMLIGTVDKFAMMAWRGETRTLFGRAAHECPRHGLLWPDCECSGNHNTKKSLPKTVVQQITPIRPPDLIIQDEFHLISGPLGTMVGLYESVVDEMSSWSLNDHKVRPKVIASTATVRKAQEQVHNVFLRSVAVFPPNGLDIEDNFFSVQRPVTEKPGRLYMGICAPGSSRPAVLIRLYVALLTAAQSLYDRFGPAADPFMTLVGYFNSLRELGGMRRLAEDDVQTRAFRVAMSRVMRPGLSQRQVRIIEELTSRVSSKEIPKKLDQLELPHKTAYAKGETRAIDVVLATNMLSVGVDVNRLGLMAVNGQPKSTAEYIQATSRVGRAFPGLVCAVLTWSRPRDLSHYETFEHYHATFYKHVEAQSVTPFAPRAMDRGLTGAMVSLLRLDGDLLNPNTGAMELTNASNPAAQAVKSILTDRAWKVADKASIKTLTEGMLAQRIDEWSKQANKPGRQLGYEGERGNVVALLHKPGIGRWQMFTVPMSLREVEPGVRLVMDTATLQEGPEWQVPTVTSKKGGQSDE